MSDDDSWLDESYRVETPERIDLSYDVAGIGSRFVAALLDTLIIGVAASLVAIFGSAALMLLFSMGAVVRRAGSAVASTEAAIAISLFLTFFVVWGYYVFFELIWHGQSPGKRMLGLRVIKEGGYPIGFVESAIRNVVRLVDFLPFYYVLGVIAMVLNRRYRRLGDYAAGTVVVKERKDVSLASLDAVNQTLVDRTIRPDPVEHDERRGRRWTPPDMASAEPTGSVMVPIANLERLTASDQSLLREYVARRSSLLKPAAERLAADLATALAKKLDHDLGRETPEAFLARLVRETGRGG